MLSFYTLTLQHMLQPSSVMSARSSTRLDSTPRLQQCGDWRTYLTLIVKMTEMKHHPCNGRWWWWCWVLGRGVPTPRLCAEPTMIAPSSHTDESESFR